jgi:hypothetical protein
MPQLSVPYAFRGVTGQVRVAVSANTRPRELGCDLLDDSLPPDAATGFPVCTAQPEIDLQGYGAACGWIQVVRSTDASDDFEMDPLAVFRDLETPFAFFGVAPLLFDAPFREARYNLTWKARAFLAGLPDGVMSKTVLPLAAFEWGFTVKADAISIDDPVGLDLAVWNEHQNLMSRAYPNWRFERAEPSRFSGTGRGGC